MRMKNRYVCLEYKVSRAPAIFNIKKIKGIEPDTKKSSKILYEGDREYLVRGDRLSVLRAVYGMTEYVIREHMSSAKQVFGKIYADNKADKVTKIQPSSLEEYPDGYIYTWGLRNANQVLFRYKDYGDTWAFSEGELL